MKKLIFILLGLISLSAYANGCGGEYQPETGTCRIIGPDGRQILYNVGQSQSGNNLPPKKIIKYVDVHVPSKYGAFAVNKRTGDGEGVLNRNSLAQAKQDAIRECEKGGRNAPCEVVKWVRNGCIAIAKGKQGNMWRVFYIGGKRNETEAVALRKCENKRLKECQIAVPEGCSLANGV